MSVRREHKFQGDPGGRCYHVAAGYVCGLPEEQHRKRAWHKHSGETHALCDICGLTYACHYKVEKKQNRVYHEFVGPEDNGPETLCQRLDREGVLCGRPQRVHRTREYPLRKQHDYIGEPDGLCTRCQLPKKQHMGKRPHVRDPFIGIDGEGKGREDHKYVFMAASDESGKRRWSVENEEGLGTEQILDFLFTIPFRRMFAYSFGYDLTKMLKDLDNGRLFVLFRPELRQRKGDPKDLDKTAKERAKGPAPIRWKQYRINIVGTKFTVTRGSGSQKETRVIWDIWKFYQSKFVEALRLWGVGTKEHVDLLERMKDQRAEFDKLPPEAIREYCFLEVQYMAELTRRLVEAHEAVGLKLTGFYGAGSCAAAMLKVMGIREKIRPVPPEMRVAVARAFFGGRFENSRMGRIKEPAYNYDISSAYPYQLCFLPCLLHGHWERTTQRTKLNGRRHALVRYGFRNNAGIIQNDWGPFPFRDANGSICYPRVSGGGWIWLDEYLAGERLYFPMIQFKEAWVYHQECNCRPFEKIPEYYRERCRIGKEGPGIVLKLGPNSCYGKLAQSVGNAVFNDWAWAGMITSGCRAQVLDFMGMHKDRANMLMVATDGLYSLEDLTPPAPKDTGTSDVYVCEVHKKTCTECPPSEWTYKPLGGWEKNSIRKGVFIAQPGVYFPWDPTQKEIKTVRGRGVGKGAVLSNWRRIVDAYEKHGATMPDPENPGKRVPTTVHIANVSRFCGAKTSVSVAHVGRTLIFNRAEGDHIGNPNRKPKPLLPEPHYGQWMQREVVMQFDPTPKREPHVHRDGRLILRSMPISQMSAPYSKAILSPDAAVMKKLEEELMEQPDIDFIDYDAGSEWG